MKLPTFRTLFWCAVYLVRCALGMHADQCAVSARCAISELDNHLRGSGQL